MKRNLSFLILALLAINAMANDNRLIAFPGAEGHGRYTTGGRGGEVYHVTTLEDHKDSIGCLRYALEDERMNKPRIILFKVSGTIFLKKKLKIKYGNVSILGQSAPGGGICIAGFPVDVASNNVIVRFIRFRMGDINGEEIGGADAFGGRFQKNIIVDHCSVSWSSDECVSFYMNENFTLQWSFITESMRMSCHPKGSHGYGGIWGGKYASFHHNLLAHHDSRNPRLGGATSATSDYVDMRNNVIYNWGNKTCYGGEAMNVNIVNCYYKLGPASPSGDKSKSSAIISIDKLEKDKKRREGAKDIWGKFYITGNVVDAKSGEFPAKATADNWTYGVYNQFNKRYGELSQETKDSLKVIRPFPTDTVTTHTAKQAYGLVLTYGGCSLNRDIIDTRIVAETVNRVAAFRGLSPRNGGGEVLNSDETVMKKKNKGYPKQGLIDSQNDLKPKGADATWSAWPALISLEAPIDTDSDGMPDAWEDAKGLNKNDKTDGIAIALDKQYTNVEVYLNSLVKRIIDNQNRVEQISE